MLVRRFTAAVLISALFIGSAASLSAQPAPGAAASAVGFDASRLKGLQSADLERIPSGCSFSATRGKDLIAISIDDIPSANKTIVRSFWFKLDGKLVEVKGKSVRTKPNDQHLGVWTGVLGGQELRIVEGKAGKGPINDGGSIGGVGSIEWGGPGTGGKLAIEWEAGC